MGMQICHETLDFEIIIFYMSILVSCETQVFGSIG